MSDRWRLGKALLLAVAACGPPEQGPDPITIADPPPTGDGRVPGAGLSDFDRGVAYVKNGAFAEAIPHFDRALAANPDNAEAHYYRALSLENQGDRAAAEKGYLRALELDAALADARNNLGALYLDQEKPRAAEAVKVLEPALKLQADAVDLRVNLALAYRLTKAWDKAAEQYEAAIKLAPSHELEFAYADLLFEAGKPEDAGPHLEKALGGYKDDLEHVVVIAHRLGKAKRFQACVDAFSRAMKLAPKEPGFPLHRGLCKHELGDEPGARADYDAALAIDPSFQPSLYYLGMSYRAANMPSRAQEYFEKAIKIDKASPVGKKAQAELDEMGRGKKKR